MWEQTRMCFLPAMICVVANFNLKAHMGTAYCATTTISEVTICCKEIQYKKIEWNFLMESN